MDEEFDHIPGDLADLDVDWERVLGSVVPSGTSAASGQFTDVQQPVSPRARSDSSSSFGFGDDMDASFLAELDRVEQDVVARSNNSANSARSPARNIPTSVHSVVEGFNLASGSHSSRYFRQPGRNSADAQMSTPNSHKRRAGSEESHLGDASPRLSKKLRNDISSITALPKGKGKMKVGGNLDRILSAYEDELCCPICCDIIAAAHIGTPCGHTFCGECGWQWFTKSPSHDCPCCREKLDEFNPIIPNISMDNVVEKHLQALAISGKEEWSTGGQMYRDWMARKEAWKKGAAQRKKKKRPIPTRRPTAVFAVEVFHPPAHWQIRDDVENDPTYEYDSEIEMVPPPPPRARNRRRQPNHPP